MAYLEYAKALKLGEKEYRNAVSGGHYPYLPALDELLECVDVQTEENLGLVDIPLDQIVGTKTVGRRNAFAGNFMPLMSEKSEFALKWTNLYNYQTEHGVNDPIIAYEFMNKFYVLEGNKRVSVFKFLNASSIEGTVTRIIPKPTDETENRIYYEFLDFYKLTGINYIWFSKEGSFAKLTKAVGKGPEETWTEEDQKNFSSIFTEFSELFESRGGKKLPITTGDAFLFYLTLYPYEELLEKGRVQKKEDLDRIWSEFPLLNKSPEGALVLEPVEDTEGNLFTKFFTLTSSKKLKVAFIHERSTEESSWTYSHELGRMHLEQVFGDRIETESLFRDAEDKSITELLQQSIDDGNHIIFTTNQKFLEASLKAALEHPEIKILNCCVNRPFKALRTYYGRMYEAKFLSGMVAGAMCENDKIAYVADYPINGTFANINAFARGAQMTNPRAKIYLHWTSSTKGNFRQLLTEENITLISDTDMIRPASSRRNFGLYQEKNGEVFKLATPIWNWGKFYERIVRDILQGTWNKTADTTERKAVNYWWGISSNIIDLIFSQNLPAGIRKLTETMWGEIYNENFNPFSGEIPLQGGKLVGVKDGCLSPEEIITMDWLVENVIGVVPSEEDLTEDAKILVDLQGSLNPAVGEK